MSEINKAAMFAAYMGANIQVPEGVYILSGVSELHQCAYGAESVEAVDDEYFEFKDCKLILTPLSEINADDAIEVAKIADLSESSRREQWGCDYQNMLQIGSCIALNFFDDYGDPYRISPKNSVAIADYLRSRGYDCGYMHISSLIDAGYAIPATE